MPSEDDHQLIAPDDPACFIDNSYPICIAVECDCEIGVVLANGVDGELHVFDDSRIGMMMRKAAVRLAEQLDDFASEIA